MLRYAHLIFAGVLWLGAALLPACAPINAHTSAVPAPSIKAMPDDALAGHWTGRWESTIHHYGDSLECNLARVDEKRFRVAFRATYAAVLTYRHELIITLEKTPTGYAFSGQEDLGLLAGGAYTYAGTVQNQTVNATFQGLLEQGTFTLTRTSP